MGSGGLRVGGGRRLAWFSQWSMSVLRCSRQQTLFISFCVASEECHERILRRSSQRFSTTRNHPVWRKVSRPQTEQGERFVIGLSIGVLLTSSQVRTSSQALPAALVRRRAPAASR